MIKCITGWNLTLSDVAIHDRDGWLIEWWNAQSSKAADNRNRGCARAKTRASDARLIDIPTNWCLTRLIITTARSIPLPENLTRKSDSVSNRIESNAFQFNEITRGREGEKERQREEERNFHSSILLIIKEAKRKGCLTLRKNCLFFHWNSKEGSLTMNERRLKADFRSNYFRECHFLAKLWNFLFFFFFFIKVREINRNEIDSPKKSRLTFLRVSSRENIIVVKKRKKKENVINIITNLIIYLVLATHYGNLWDKLDNVGCMLPNVIFKITQERTYRSFRGWRVKNHP